MITPLATSQFANMATMASPSPLDTTAKTMTQQKQQERLELITYVKAHFDLVAVTLLVAYLTYSIYQMNKSKR
jgi:hypothetical protein